MELVLRELPQCPKCEVGLLPFEDVSDRGTAYLKGWLCPDCGQNVVFKSGSFIKLPLKDYTDE